MIVQNLPKKVTPESSSIFELFDALLSPEKSDNLFCPSDAVQFALEMILQMSTSIESFIYFDEQLQITKHLQSILRQSTMIDSNMAIIKF